MSTEIERTLSIIKPDAVARGCIGGVISKIEAAGFKIHAQKLISLSKQQAAKFYAIHSMRPFFEELVSFMSSGPCIVQILEKTNAVSDYRTLMGATDPTKAAIGTIRHEFAENIERNAVHGSDSIENALNELAFFFSGIELVQFV